MKHELSKVTPESAQSLLGKETAEVNLRVLIPMLVYLRKFFSSVQATNRNTPSRFTNSEDFQLSVLLQGFTPEDFNALNSLSNSMGAEFTAMLDEMATKSPQMARPGVYTKGNPKFEAPRETTRPFTTQDIVDTVEYLEQCNKDDTIREIAERPLMQKEIEYSLGRHSLACMIALPVTGECQCGGTGEVDGEEDEKTDED